jgi:tetratricopeptide (TPR) repeat protein
LTVAEELDWLFRMAEEAVYRCTAAHGDMIYAIERARSLATLLEDPVDRDFWLGECAYLEGMAELLARRRTLGRQRRRAATLFRFAAELGSSAVAREEFSDGYRLLAEAYALQVFTRGLSFQLRHGTSCRDYALRALELDFGNFRAHTALAGYYLNAPRVAGGDPMKALEVLRAAERITPRSRNEEFLLEGWLALTHSRLGDGDGAQRRLRRALVIYPENSWIRSIAEAVVLRQNH